MPAALTTLLLMSWVESEASVLGEGITGLEASHNRKDPRRHQLQWIEANAGLGRNES